MINKLIFENLSGGPDPRDGLFFLDFDIVMWVVLGLKLICIGDDWLESELDVGSMPAS